ncbi:Na(+)/H(+) antiporter subunit B [Lederbergia citrea]|uniref:Na(+)/H(+) antiporter subunit B n=1 Tax=Lederbergia citrea TaxID=2833581 RepID=A0A942UPE7_9BACI|nr:Na(+)/H(+) antiporter subunit B [Lederbergia citrea]MBS4176329.1 Na(+)/H(+) antiporter subunit B [Lederbergia citrea]MBS4202890.1 Na(+)/H(+) antiporter subunit B [Lederbergia citrea]MBS4222443.1 Na(+)/H(+) antiporter subunit B [Lederbergia citrea]
MKVNDVILQTVTRIVVFIILTLGVYLFLSGHNSPGGGFIGGLVLASALVLLYLAFDIETVHKGIPFDFKRVAALGAFIAVTSGFMPVIFGKQFLNQTFSHFNLPVFGETELATVIIFEAGVALAVVGVVVTIILSISEDV